MTIFQVGMAVLAVAVFFWDKLKTLVAPSLTVTNDDRIAHLQQDTANLVDIASHLEAHGRHDQTKLCVELIQVLIEIQSKAPEPGPSPTPPNIVPSGSRR